MRHFIRKIILEKRIYEVNLGILRNLYATVFIVTNNLNQVAKRINQIGVIYKSDMEDTKNFIGRFSKEQEAIHLLLLRKTKEI